MTWGSRTALVLAVVLVLAGVTPAMGGGTAATAQPNSASAGEPDATSLAGGQDDGTTDRDANGTRTIETEGFEPSYDPETVLERVERLRGLSALGDITLHEYDREGNVTRDVPDRFNGIRPAGAQSLQLYSNASTERRQPLGYAVQEGEGVHVHLMNASDVETYGIPQEVVLAHELVHALQFQHELLTPRREQFRPESGGWTTDARLVATALVEGDAMWVTEQYRNRYAPGEGDYAVGEYNRTLARAAWPNSVGGTPYYYGYEFYAATGASPDDRSIAIERPPNSTADLLHPNAPVERAPIPESPEVPDDWELRNYHTDSVGELVIRHALRVNGLSFSRAAAAAEGWANDRMDYYYDEEAGPATHWATVWADEREASEFAETWRSMLRDNGARASDDVLAVPASDHAPGVYYVVEQDGNAVRITAASNEELAERLADAA